jgi:predicted CopG family antitoxin
MSKTTILVETDTRDRLRKLGMKGQSYDELIRSLIEQHKGRTVGLSDSAQADERRRQQ